MSVQCLPVLPRVLGQQVVGQFLGLGQECKRRATFVCYMGSIPNGAVRKIIAVNLVTNHQQVVHKPGKNRSGRETLAVSCFIINAQNASLNLLI